MIGFGRFTLTHALLTVVVTAALPPRTVFAQAAVATLSGRVTDPQTAPAPGATLTVRHQDTAATWTGTTDEDGRFTVPMLLPAPTPPG